MPKLFEVGWNRPNETTEFVERVHHARGIEHGHRTTGLFEHFGVAEGLIMEWIERCGHDDRWRNVGEVNSGEWAHPGIAPLGPVAEVLGVVVAEVVHLEDVASGEGHSRIGREFGTHGWVEQHLPGESTCPAELLGHHGSQGCPC